MGPDNMQGSVAAIICAAGSSSRMGGLKKEFLPLPAAGIEGRVSPPGTAGKPLTVLASALNAFVSSSRIGPIVITVPPGSEAAARSCLPPELCQNRVLFAAGGTSRRASVYNALSQLEPYHPSHVLIHDGARPWIKPELVEQIIDAAIRFDAVIPALPVLETAKELFSHLPDREGIAAGEGPVFIKRHLRRSDLCSAQTPQGFSFPQILEAHRKAAEREAAARKTGAWNNGEKFEYTDDAEVWGEFAGQVAVIPGDIENRKITYPEDMRC